MLGVIHAFWGGKSVFVTGHTGFKGGWLSLWLQSMGAKVHGYALAPLADPSLFSITGVGDVIASSTIGDIRDYGKLSAALTRAKPEIIFHLAAQPLVRSSYLKPVETYEVNVMGVVYLLEAVRAADSVRSVVNVTTDKCYENHEWVWGYREHEAMGGRDPYSSSKGCAELVTAAYRNSFLAARDVAVATARAGNVIGGGDLAEDRLLPDIIRAIDSGRPLTIRQPHATRPWQHVLEPLSGYLALAERLYVDGRATAEAWNFGPPDDDARTVEWIVEHIAARHPLTWQRDTSEHPHEANYLKLDSSKARARLGWTPRWRLETALEKTLEWHRAWRDRGDMRAVTLAQVSDYLTEKSTPNADSR